MTVNSDTYDTLRSAINLKTNDFCKRGFARELKSLLLKDQEFSLTDLEHEMVASTFQQQFDKIQSTKSDHEKIEYNFIESSGFSKWWNGQNFPGKNSQNAVDELFPGLTTKWFNRRDFENRLQLHLASLDLFYLSRKCKCERYPISPFGDNSHCDSCLKIAYDEACNILDTIHRDWKPINTRCLNQHDVCISGPKERSGYNPFANIMDLLHANCSELNYETKHIDQRAAVNYNLDLFDTSFAGLLIPEKFITIYEDLNPLTITAFLFLVLCLNIHAMSDYRDDLVLDFLTSLNCAAFILQYKNGSILLGNADSFEQKLEHLWFHANEYFYDKNDNLEKTLMRFEKRYLVPPRAQVSELTILPFQYIANHTGTRLVDVFFDLFKLTQMDTKSEEYENILTYLEESSIKREKLCEKYMDNEAALIFSSLEDSRKRYYRILSITGYPSSEIEKKLKKMICRPIDIIYSCGKEPQERSPYSRPL